MTENIKDIEQALSDITQQLRPMHLAQLTAYAFKLPALYFCKSYYTLDQQQIVNACYTRLLNALISNEISLQTLNQLRLNNTFFEEEEATIRVTPTDTE